MATNLWLEGRRTGVRLILIVAKGENCDQKPALIDLCAAQAMG
jgi:hypothetical protein